MLSSSVGHISFNEAAANGRGNRGDRGLCCSLRRRFNEAAANGRGNPDDLKLPRLCIAASMRPRRMAAEIELLPRIELRSRNASMRPRRMAAEIVGYAAARPVHSHASMRPRRMAAEITRCRAAARRPAAGFNEAAANGRGNRPSHYRLVGRDGASMRPRRMAAEITTIASRGVTLPISFNEAAANGRGNRETPINRPVSGSGFNEAAANGRGNRTPCASAVVRIFALQ